MNLRRALHSYILGSISLKRNVITDFDPPTAAAAYNGGTGGTLYKGNDRGDLEWRNVWAMLTHNAHYPRTLPAQYNAAVRRFNGANPPAVKPALTLWR